MNAPLPDSTLLTTAQPDGAPVIDPARDLELVRLLQYARLHSFPAHIDHSRNAIVVGIDWIDTTTRARGVDWLTARDMTELRDVLGY